MASPASRQGGIEVDFPYEDLVGSPFVDGGRDAKGGLDCWGLCLEAFKRQGTVVKDYHIAAVNAAEIADEMQKEEPSWVKLEEPVVGCLVVIKLTPGCWANHAGIYVGGGRFLHAYSPTGACIDRLKRWKSRIVGFYRPGGEWH